MATSDEMRAEKDRLERELQKIKDNERWAKERTQRQKIDAFELTQGVHVNCSDDYAGLTVGCYGPIYKRYDNPPAFEFYYGYEKTVCKTHTTEKECRDADCEDNEWAFVAKRDGTEVYRIGASSLAPDLRDVVEGLLCGIGLWLKADPTNKRGHV